MIGQVGGQSLWDLDAMSVVLAGARLAPGTAEFDSLSTQLSSTPSTEHCSIGLPMFASSKASTTSAGAQCSCCQVTLASREQQVEHYREPWHLNNLKRATQGQPPLTHMQFETGHDTASCTSSEDEGSTADDDNNSDNDEEDDEGNEKRILSKQPRIFFLNADGQVFSVYRSVLLNKRVEMSGETDAKQRLQAAPRKRRWAVLLLSGGHFAGAIFNGEEVDVHKTFHNYTVRAGQGGSQSHRDNQSATSHPRSSGSSLRRYNEQSQRQHIQELLESWRPKLNSCNLIFCHTRHSSQSALFSGKNPILSTSDDRIRNVPFTTRRPKFAEVQRVHAALSEVLIHGTEEEFGEMVRASQESKKTIKPKLPKASKTQRKLKTERKKKGWSDDEDEDEVESEGEVELSMEFATIGLEAIGGGPDCVLGNGSDITEEEESQEDERQHKQEGMLDKGGVEDWMDNERKDREGNRKKRKGKKRKNKLHTGSPDKTRVWDSLHKACSCGDVKRLQLMLRIARDGGDETDVSGSSLSAELLSSIAAVGIELNQVKFGKKERTMLHIAAEKAQLKTVRWLLENDCDPSISDQDGKTPYQDSHDKDTRNVFRRFMAHFPDRYQYDKANIPGPLTQAMEEDEAAKRKAQKLAKNTRKKDRKKKEKEEEERKLEEEQERKRFLSLTDREKRALAAERRMQQSGADTPATTSTTTSSTSTSYSSTCRCFQCGCDISTLDPFHYNDYKFCSTKCVREHRTGSGKS
ncbi:hypothetical protein Pmani_005046 [Petrolisthes manimaculis]|uniref:VLRF1 domain-containing protein n=1 Tax=Petrolisthes manimaculis TaxID=1843537 RepID=A0AAE1QCZ5_9EUCA|nr:hypothetical protein Pmani_005046 [Petrolisthes manimaculis]